MRILNGFLALTMIAAAPSQAWATTPAPAPTATPTSTATQPQQPPQQHQRHRRVSAREAFFIGVCAGQAVAAQGLSVPNVQAGQALNLDSPTQAALEEAFANCKAQASAPSDGAAPTDSAPTDAAPAPAPSPSPAPAAPATSG